MSAKDEELKEGKFACTYVRRCKVQVRISAMINVCMCIHLLCTYVCDTYMHMYLDLLCVCI